jgi:hypothetical protein
MGMANLTEEQREQNRARQLRRHKRSVARDLAQDHAAKALDALMADAPEWFDADQVRAYSDELQRLRVRIVGSPFQG